MSNPIPIELSLDLLPTSQASASAGVSCEYIEPGTEKLFKDILADENLLSDLMAKLKEALPEELYTQIEEAVDSGNGLPLAAIFSPESGIFSQGLSELPNGLKLDGLKLDGLKLDGLKLDGNSIPSFVASTLKIGDYLQKTKGEAADRTLDNLGRNISESLNQVANKGEGLAKQIHELLAVAKSEFSISNSVPKFSLQTHSSADGSMTPTTALGTAVSGLVQLPSQPTSAASLLSTAVSTPMGAEGWSQAMGDRIMWMAGKGVQAASIRINPPHLGPIQVQLSVQNDQTNVQILVQHGVVKEALEAAMPRLREMLNESNLQLVNVDVSHRESPDQSSRSAMFSQNQREQMEQFLQDQDPTNQMEEEAPRYYRSNGLLDDYA
jgi:flagellar hook-length control protein FliK